MRKIWRSRQLLVLVAEVTKADINDNRIGDHYIILQVIIITGGKQLNQGIKMATEANICCTLTFDWRSLNVVSTE